MEELNCCAHFKAMVVGSSTDRLIGHTVNLLDEFEIDFIECDDVYSAVCELARNAHEPNIFIIGRFEQLNRENGRFFDIARRYSHSCCCLVGSSSKYERLLELMQSGIFVASEPQQIRRLLSNLLLTGYRRPLTKKAAVKAAAFNREKFAATKAELEVLFGD